MSNNNLRKRARRLAVDISEAHWNLSPILLEIYEGAMWIDWGFKTFRSYVESELNVSQRTAQNLVKLGAWYRSMPVPCQKWARTVPYTKMNIINSDVTRENWKEWREIVKDRTVSDLVAYLRARNELMVKKAAAEGALLRLKTIAPNELVALRRTGLSAPKIAVQTGMDVSDIRAIAPFITSFVPRAVHQRIVRMAMEHNHTVSDEIAWVLSEVFSENSVREAS